MATSKRHGSRNVLVIPVTKGTCKFLVYVILTPVCKAIDLIFY